MRIPELRDFFFKILFPFNFPSPLQTPCFCNYTKDVELLNSKAIFFFSPPNSSTSSSFSQERKLRSGQLQHTRHQHINNPEAVYVIARVALLMLSPSQRFSRQPSTKTEGKDLPVLQSDGMFKRVSFDNKGERNYLPPLSSNKQWQTLAQHAKLEKPTQGQNVSASRLNSHVIHVLPTTPVRPCGTNSVGLIKKGTHTHIQIGIVK